MEETTKEGLNTSSNSYTIIYSVVIVVLVAFLLAFVSSTLKPQQDENVALDKKKQILAALNIRDIDGAEATEQYNKVVTADMIINRDGTTIAKGEQGGTKTGFLCNSASTKEGKLALYVCNVDDVSAAAGNAYVDAVREAIKDENAQMLVIAAQTESEIAELDTYEERQMFLQEIGLQESGVNRLIKSAYALLNLQTFLTAGPKEVRAWTFHKGDKAPQCAGVIHSDFERGFIRAEVIHFDDLMACGTMQNAKEKGLVRSEGKEYVMKDGDIVLFRFNV